MVEKKLVIIESPYKGGDNGGAEYLDKNVEYAKACMRDSFKRGEYPFLSHLLYTQVLDDKIPEERTLGIDAGLTWGKNAEITAVYQDLGISKGMEKGIERAVREGRPIEYRWLYKKVEEEEISGVR